MGGGVLKTLIISQVNKLKTLFFKSGAKTNLYAPSKLLARARIFFESCLELAGAGAARHCVFTPSGDDFWRRDTKRSESIFFFFTALRGGTLSLPTTAGTEEHQTRGN